MSGRRSRGLAVLIGIVVLLVLGESALVIAVFVSPSAGDRLESVAAAADRAWSGTERRPGIAGRVSDAFHTGYRDWIEAMWSRPSTPSVKAEFTRCVKCHADYARKRRFSAVYMNHPMHAELGVACATCHQQNAHPDPVPPAEQTCETCHDEVRSQASCTLCHPPASLPHFALLGAPRDRVVECSVCHPRNAFTSTADTPLVHVEHFDGTDRSTCTQCHEASTCRQCHAERHPTNWTRLHGAAVGEDATPCYRCHTGDWCASRCHAVTPTAPFVPRPLPSSGVRP
jgi:hypothetical protein